MMGYTWIEMAFLAAVLVPPPFPAHLRNLANGAITQTSTPSREGVRP